MRPNIIIVANRLPFSIQQGPAGLKYVPSPGGMAAALAPVRDHYHAQWVGWAGLDRPLHSAERETLKIPGYAHIVDIPAKQYHDYYYNVANGTLWPVLHGLKPRRMYTMADWQSNLRVNKLFAARIVEVAKPEDIIWIHDFHLFMLPGMLRKFGLKNRIGFFLHIPVADVAHLRILPYWKDMLRSLQAADVCGMQTERDATNLRASFDAFRIPAPAIQVFPVGIDPKLFGEAPDGPPIEKNSKTVILSVSRLDYTKGIIHQLQAIRELLRQKLHKNIMYKLIVAPSREALTEYRDLKQATDLLVADINQRNPGTVAYEYRNFELPELAAWYRRADVMLVAPLIDGMNLVAKEYIAARKQPGVLVLSQQAGAAAQLAEALIVNSKDPKNIAAALHKAIIMPASEQQERFAALQHTIAKEDVYAWAEGFVEALEQR